MLLAPVASACGLLLVTVLWAASPEAREPSRSETLIVTLISIKEWCDTHSPEVKTRNQAAYDRWSKTNGAAISSLQQTSEYRDWLDGSTAQLTERHREFACTFREVDAKTTELIWTSGGETKTTRFRRVLGIWKITTI